MSLFSLHDVSYSYGNTMVFSGINVDIEEDELTVITGVNGVGKTTLLQIIAGLLKPTTGVVEKNFSGRVAYVSQEGIQEHVSLPMSVSEFVGSWRPKHTYKKGKCDYTTLDDCLRHVGLFEQKHDSLDTLSGGQKQRAIIAKALMLDPDVLLLDEPTAGIDITMQDQFYELIQHFNSVHGLATVMITHDAVRQYTFGDHVICLTKGTSPLGSLQDRFQQKKVTFLSV